jgi:hypothetical protein
MQATTHQALTSAPQAPIPPRVIVYGALIYGIVILGLLLWAMILGNSREYERRIAAWSYRTKCVSGDMKHLTQKAEQDSARLAMDAKSPTPAWQQIADAIANGVRRPPL